MRAQLTAERPATLEDTTYPPTFPVASSLPLEKSDAASRAPFAFSATHAREFRYRAASLLLMGDWVVAVFSIFAGLFLRECQLTLDEKRPILFSELILWSAGAACLFVWIMAMLRTYEIGNLFRPSRVLKNIGRAVLLWSTCIWASFGLFRAAGFTPRLGAIYCMGTLAVMVAVWRIGMFKYLMRPEVRRKSCSRVLVIGWNQRAAQMNRAFAVSLGDLRQIIGCISGPSGLSAEYIPSSVPILGTMERLAETIREYGIHCVVMSDTSCSATEIQKIASLCQKEMVGFQVILDYFPALTSTLQVQSVNGIPLLGISELPLDHTANRVAKRALDIVGSVLGLAASALVIPWFCALVYFESPGPVLYRQRRMSRNGKDFSIFKIRSMRLNAEASTGAVWCNKEDDRRLRIGKFMRRWNIDELPQFWNVLIGDMSLVGPRPERPELIARFKHEIPNYSVRHEVRAGLTGWAQINGLRGDTDLRKRIEADLYYLENWTLSLDLYCLLATIFSFRNAH